MITTRYWTQRDSHLFSPTSQPLWLRRLFRRRQRDDTLGQGDPGAEAGRRGCVLTLGIGLSDLQMGESAQSSVTPRKGTGLMRGREDPREAAEAGANTTSVSSRPAHLCLKCCKPHLNLAGPPPPQSLAVTLMSRVRLSWTNPQPSPNPMPPG